MLPSDSYLYIEGKIERKGETSTEEARNIMPKYINNAAAFLFEEIKYLLNGVEIDRCKNVGLTSTMKGYVSLKEDDIKRYSTSSWNIESSETSSTGDFSYYIPLKLLFGFFEDIRNIILNSKHELVIIRSRSDINENSVGNATCTSI